MNKIGIALTRLGIRTLGQTSQGMRLVTHQGLTSGVMLEYIYRNKPEGSFLIGRMIDKVFLSHRAWEDVRIRKSNLEKYLLEAIAIEREQQRKPIILDVASGSARYILNVLQQDGMKDARAVCRDMDEDVLRLGRANAEQLGLDNVVFESGDAFSAQSLATAKPVPNIAVSSGFYDWINEDEMVQKSMSLIYDVLPPGGCFVFTNQARHVNQEFVQAVFPDLHGNPLRMTLRPAATVNAWAEDAGFKIVKTTGDRDYNYSVTLAQKPLV